MTKKKPAPTTETWEVWAGDHYIKGKLLKTLKSKDAAVKYAKKHIKYKYLAPDPDNNRKKKEGHRFESCRTYHKKDLTARNGHVILLIVEGDFGYGRI